MQIRLSSVGIGLLLSLLFLSSCGSTSHHFYATDEGNLLALQESQDLKVSAGYTPHLNSLPGNNMNFQLGYSPIKHLGIQSNFFRQRNAFDGFEGEKKNVYQYHYSGAVGGYFFKPAKELVKDEEGNEEYKTIVATNGKGLLFDGYIGYSRGNIKNYYFQETGIVNLDYQKFYLQGGVHIFLDRIAASFTLRYANLDYLDGTAFGKLTPAQLDKINIIEANNSFNLLESSLQISYGKPTAPVRVFMTISGLYDFGDVFLEIQPSTMQIGVQADIGSLF